MIKNDPIYTLTTLYMSKTSGTIVRSRTVAFFHELETAKEYLEDNHGNLEEAGWYTEAIIEEIPPGIYVPRDFEKRWYYRWCDRSEGGCWVSCGPFPGNKEIVNYCDLG